MGTEILTSFGNLQHELDEARNNLKGVDESIKRLIGRDPSDLPPRNIPKRTLNDDKFRTTNKLPGRARLFTENEEPPVKRRGNISVFKRLSEKVPDDDSPVPNKGLISKVIVTPKEVPSREQALEAQSKDEKYKARNRRMFGALLGTLQKFQQEETKLKQREQKRAVLEKKIEDHEIKEKEEVRKERQELFLNRKRKQAEIKVIELKMLRMKDYTSWEQSQKPRTHFIKTKAKPYIHYLPRKMCDQSKKLLEESSKEIDDIIDKKKKQVAEELEHIEFKIKRNFDHKSSTQKEEDIAKDDESDNRHENDQNEYAYIEENQVEGTVATIESDNQLQPELEVPDLDSIQLPADTEHESTVNNSVEYSFEESVPDEQHSMVQSEEYNPEIIIDNGAQLENITLQTGE